MVIVTTIKTMTRGQLAVLKVVVVEAVDIMVLKVEG